MQAIIFRFFFNNAHKMIKITTVCLFLFIKLEYIRQEDQKVDVEPAR